MPHHCPLGETRAEEMPPAISLPVTIAIRYTLLEDSRHSSYRTEALFFDRYLHVSLQPFPVSRWRALSKKVLNAFATLFYVLPTFYTALLVYVVRLSGFFTVSSLASVFF